MGATMMPIMSAALQTLRGPTVARGSTLLNIIQQVAASIGTAIFSVLLTNGMKNDVDLMGANPLADLAGVFSSTFWVATVMIAVVLIPAFLLPRKKADAPVDPALMMGH